jgi:hypothetical protein
MSPTTDSRNTGSIPRDVLELTNTRRIGEYLDQVLEVARQAFPSSRLRLSVGQDAEDESHRYVAIDVESSDRTVEELLAGQEAWALGLARVCPSHHAVHFVLGWR